MTEWRIGKQVPLNVYEGDVPMFQCHTPEQAARVVSLLNAGKAITLLEAQNKRLREALIGVQAHQRTIEWPDPTPEMLHTPQFEAIWECIKSWDINVPGAYGGYCGATGNHVRAIIDALVRCQHDHPTRAEPSTSM